MFTKPHFNVIENICSQFPNHKENILFRFTIGSCNTETLKFWEPNAPSFEERLRSLMYAFNQGFKTSVSCEPILDTDIIVLLEHILPFITDAVWIGKPNFLIRRLRTNGITDQYTIQRAEQLNNCLSDAWILGLYEQIHSNPKIKWKESIKKIVKLEISTIKGQDK